MRKPEIVVFFIVLFGFSLPLAANLPVLGRVVDGHTTEALSGAKIYVGSRDVAVTDDYGFFYFSSSDSIFHISITALGYHSGHFLYQFSKSDTIEFEMYPLNVEIEEVTIVHSSDSKFIRDTRTGIIDLSTEDSRYLPLFLGQADLFKTLELMPGYRTGGEGDASIYIRGGYFDQNLILLDGAPVYNPSHLLGFYSVFNPDIVNHVELIKSGIPVEYGNRLSSVILSNSDNNIPKSTSGGINLGILSTGAMINTPLVDDKLSVFFGFRRSHIGMILRLMDDLEIINSRSVEFQSDYDFYDINGGVIFKPNPNHHLQINLYKGRDIFSMVTPAILLDADLTWGNELLSFNWNHKLSPNFSLFHNLYYSDYDFDIKLRNPAYDLLLTSGVRALGQKSKVVYTTDNFKYSAGLDNKYQKFIPNSSNIGTQQIEFDFGSVDNYYLGEYSMFFSIDGQLTNRWMFSAGTRLNYSVHYGPYNKFIYDEEGVLSDTIFYKGGKAAAHFISPDLMASLRFMLSNLSSLKLSFNRNHQFAHMVNATSVSFPLDFWVASGLDIPVQKGWQIAGGYYHLTDDRIFQTSIEAYYKHTKNHSEFNNYFMQSVDNTPLVESLVFGKGRSWGVEYLLSKVKGKMTGWLAYTFSKSISSIKEIENGRWFPTAYDRPHDISLVMSMDHNEKWKFGATFVYSTGRPYTPSIGRYFFENNVINIYGARNSARFPDYHRIDLSATRVFKDTEKRYSALVFSIYNVYNRSNPFFIFPKAYGDIEQYELTVEPFKVSIFPLLPSVSWQFKF